MANTKITALTAIDAVVAADVVVIVDDVAGTPVTKKATIAQILASVPIVDTPSATNASALTWTAGTPITSVNSTYSWHRVGKFVHVRGNINGTAGLTITNVSFPLPGDLPTPAKPTGVSGNLAACYDGYCNMRTSLSSAGNTGRCTLRTNSTDSGFEISCNASSGSHLQVVWEVAYQAA